MKFLIGVLVGATIARPGWVAIDKQFGHVLRPKLAQLTLDLHNRVSK
jgi:hypothetical protein